MLNDIADKENNRDSCFSNVDNGRRPIMTNSRSLSCYTSEKISFFHSVINHLYSLIIEGSFENSAQCRLTFI